MALTLSGVGIIASASKNEEIMVVRGRRLLKSFLLTRDAVTSIEYALIALLIFLVIITGVTLTGTNLKPIFNAVSNGF